MAEGYSIQITVKKVKGQCSAGHYEGQRFVCGQTTPAGVCNWAYGAILPFLTPLQFGGAFPWSADADSAEAVCPDGGNPVTFEMRRIVK